MQKILLLHGWGGSDYPHWQSWLAGEVAKAYGCICFPLLHNPHFPSKKRLMRQILEIMKSFAPDTVICHSLACTLWFHLCEAGEIPHVRRLLLVAPPANSCHIGTIRKFFPFPIPRDLHAKEATLITSTDDPYMSQEEAKALQKSLGIEMMVLEDAGHINDKSGFGPWPWALEWVHKGA